MNKFKGIKDVLQIAIKATLIVLIVYGSFWYFNQVFYDKTVYRGESFKALPEDSMDVLVIGSSHAQYSFVPAFFYQETGLYSYVLGSACQPLEVSYEMLKEALKTQSPKLVILEVYTAMPLRELCEADSCYVLAEYQMTGQERINTINYLPKDKAETYYNDFISLHNNWRYVEDYDRVLPQNVFKEKDKINGSFGHVFSEPPEQTSDNWWHPAVYQSSQEVELDELDLQSLNNIYNLCEENGIELFLYKAPMDSIDIENQSYLYKVWEWAEEREVAYIDFIKESDSLDYYMWIHSDSYHAYINGAGLITEHLAKTINTLDYEFNHIEDVELETLYNSADQGYLISYLKAETDPLKYFKQLENSKGHIFLRYNPESTKLKNELYELLISIGANEFDIYKPYYAVIKDNQIVVESNDSIEYQLAQKEIRIDEAGIYIDGELINKPNAPLGFIYATNDMDSYVNKRIVYSQRIWDYKKEIYSQ